MQWLMNDGDRSPELPGHVEQSIITHLLFAFATLLDPERCLPSGLGNQLEPNGCARGGRPCRLPAVLNNELGRDAFHPPVECRTEPMA